MHYYVRCIVRKSVVRSENSSSTCSIYFRPCVFEIYRDFKKRNISSSSVVLELLLSTASCGGKENNRKSNENLPASNVDITFGVLVP